jgi:hypothetical protein
MTVGEAVIARLLRSRNRGNLPSLSLRGLSVGEPVAISYFKRKKYRLPRLNAYAFRLAMTKMSLRSSQ